MSDHLCLEPEDTFEERKQAAMLSKWPKEIRLKVEKHPEDVQRVAIPEIFLCVHPEGLQSERMAEIPCILARLAAKGIVSETERLIEIRKASKKYDVE